MRVSFIEFESYSHNQDFAATLGWIVDIMTRLPTYAFSSTRVLR